ncbi:MAG TPA: hypothetical protein VG675_01160 [Bryobacteraceae bacterium]|nr:hypothetical protein [Bryobacteraceae bacterium]
MCILSGSLAAGILPDGASGSVFFLGFPVGLALLGGAIEIILSGLLTATAYGAIVGHFKGIDAGVSLLPGYAR